MVTPRIASPPAVNPPNPWLTLFPSVSFEVLPGFTGTSPSWTLIHHPWASVELSCPYSEAAA